MLPSDLIRSTIDLIILSILTGEPNYGYAIGKHISQVSDQQYPIKETTLYAAIRRLEKRGDLESFTSAESGGRPRTYYSITPQGEQQLQTSITQWHATTAIIARFLDEEREQS